MPLEASQRAREAADLPLRGLQEDGRVVSGCHRQLQPVEVHGCGRWQILPTELGVDAEAFDIADVAAGVDDEP